MTSRPSTAAPILAVLAVVLVTLGAYVGGYFGLGEHYQHPFASTNTIYRVYRHEWEASLFAPAAWVEGRVRERDVRVTTSFPTMLRIPRH